jgi:hypothetical protein
VNHSPSSIENDHVATYNARRAGFNVSQVDVVLLESSKKLGQRTRTVFGGEQNGSAGGQIHRNEGLQRKGIPIN